MRALRLGLDIGTTSIGWWLYETEQGEIKRVVDGGVRIFSDGRDPKSGTSLAVDRRQARAMRRRRDRFLRRRSALLRELVMAGLLPQDKRERKGVFGLDPYALRGKAIREKIELHELGRILFHINQRRGFKSNRKTDGKDNEAGKIKQGTKRLEDEMEKLGARTYGEFLHMRRRSAMVEHQIPPVRTRMGLLRGLNEPDQQGYEFYPDRSHLEKEFDKIWAVQRAFHSGTLTEDLRKSLRKIIFHQRPLKPPKVGRCLYMEEDRLPKAHPLASRRILMETVNHLRIVTRGEADRALSWSQRQQVLKELDFKKHTKSMLSMKVTFKQLRSTLMLRKLQSFNLDKEGRDSIACDQVLASLSHPDRFGNRWRDLTWEDQWTVVNLLLNEQDQEEIEGILISEWGLSQERARNVANAPLPEGYTRIGLTATQKILGALEEDVVTYSEAVEKCGWHHSDHRKEEGVDMLPYYGEILDRHVIPGTQDPNDEDITRFGRVTNPTVHIGLNQLRRLVNRVINVYGKPDEIVVELARELKQSYEQKRRFQKINKEGRKAAELRGKKLEELNQPNTGANRLLLRMWEDLAEDCIARRCPYSGKTISVTMLFDGSCDVDHILPYSRTLDDSPANKTICIREFNRIKGKQTPWEAWGGTPQWETIQSNLKKLPNGKRWRFLDNAMEKWNDEEAFLDRALVDTQYLSRIANEYLTALYDSSDGRRHVWVVPGRLTEMLRRHWGLNNILSDGEIDGSSQKNRTDHRHHAIDAAVIAATDQALVKRISDAARELEEIGAEGVAKRTPPPWEGFRSDIEHRVGEIVVSHRTDHGKTGVASGRKGEDSTSGQLHNETAYGLTEADGNGAPLVTFRIPLEQLAEKPNRTENIRDERLKRELTQVLKGKTDNKEAANELAKYARSSGTYRGIRRVRLIEPIETIHIHDRDGRAYKGYKPDSNHCYEVWELPDGAWKAQVLTTFDAHQGYKAAKPHPAARRIMRLFAKDMLKLSHPEQGTIIVSVVKFVRDGRLTLVPHNEANADARNRDKDDPFKFLPAGPTKLKLWKAQKLRVDEMGRCRSS